MANEGGSLHELRHQRSQLWHARLQSLNGSFKHQMSSDAYEDSEELWRLAKTCWDFRKVICWLAWIFGGKDFDLPMPSFLIRRRTFQVLIVHKTWIKNTWPLHRDASVCFQWTSLRRHRHLMASAWPWKQIFSLLVWKWRLSVRLW